MSGTSGSKVDKEAIRRRVIEALKQVYDPEIPVNVVDLGLVYDVNVDDEGRVHVRMTMTSPFCPVAGLVLMQAEDAIRRMVPEAKDVTVELVFEPPWTPDRITPEGREQLKKLFGYDVVEEWKRRMQQSGLTQQ